MKFIITESKFEQIVFKYLDNQDFIKIEKDNYIYFLNSTDYKYAEIRYDKNDGRCFIYTDLVAEISSFFSIESHDSKELIGEWVENTLQMEVSNTIIDWWGNNLQVENTLQMEVSNTKHGYKSRLYTG